MYEYSEYVNLLPLELPSNVEAQLDTLPTQYPYVPRICDRQAHFLIWWGTKETDPLIYDDAIRAKHQDPMFVKCSQDWMLEKGVSMLHIYENEVIIGTMKTAGYMNRTSNTEIRSLLRTMWADIVSIFGNKRLIVPAGSMLEYIHLSMNQCRIPHEPYHRELMQQFGFKRNKDYWVRVGTAEC